MVLLRSSCAVDPYNRGSQTCLHAKFVGRRDYLSWRESFFKKNHYHWKKIATNFSQNHYQFFKISPQCKWLLKKSLLNHSCMIMRRKSVVIFFSKKILGSDFFGARKNGSDFLALLKKFENPWNRPIIDGRLDKYRFCSGIF